MQFARTEGIIPAPEPAHAIRAVIEEAEAAREAGEARVILFGFCGHGHFDLAAYDAYLSGDLEDLGAVRGRARAALDGLPEAPGDRRRFPVPSSDRMRARPRSVPAADGQATAAGARAQRLPAVRSCRRTSAG